MEKGNCELEPDECSREPQCQPRANDAGRLHASPGLIGTPLGSFTTRTKPLTPRGALNAHLKITATNSRGHPRCHSSRHPVHGRHCSARLPPLEFLAPVGRSVVGVVFAHRPFAVRLPAMLP